MVAPFTEQHFLSLKFAENVERAAAPDTPVGRPDIGDALPGSLPQRFSWFGGDVVPGLGGPWPNASNTGVPAGTTLTHPPVDGDGNFFSSANGQVIDSVEILSGAIVIVHDNVTVRRSRVNVGPTTTAGFFINNNRVNTIIEDCELVGAGEAGGFLQNDGNTGLIVRRCNIHGSGDGFHIADGSYTIEDNYIHDLGDIGNPDPHVDGVQCTQNSSNVIIRGNNFDMTPVVPLPEQGASAGIQFYLQVAPNNSNWLIENNRIVLYATGPAPGALTIRLPTTNLSANNIRVKNNFLGAGIFGYFEAGTKTNITEWSGNVDYLTGASV